jgi:glutamine amidotransferase
MIGIIDYGLGNISAFLSVYKRLNIPASVVRSPDELEGAERLILPGVGSFDHAMELLQKSGMYASLEDFVLTRRKPILGVCIGMQIMAKSSEEGVEPGLGWIRASVRKLGGAENKFPLRLPHMGWNDVVPVTKSMLFKGLEHNSRFYFLHSYYFDCEDSGAALAETDYGLRFVCAVNLSNIYGVQFHPEKSHEYGIRLLKNFSEV